MSMDERFDPAVRSVLGAMGRARVPTTAPELVEILARSQHPDASALRRDPIRLKTILDQLVENGLAATSDDGYALTHLGRMRVEQAKKEKD